MKLMCDEDVAYIQEWWTIRACDALGLRMQVRGVYVMVGRLQTPSRSANPSASRLRSGLR